ncbi:hypothetical protein SLA2020_486660 [Shorea laevis]
MDDDVDPISLYMVLDQWQDEDDLYQSSQSSSETYMLGFVIANIVGLQYYRGKISGREMVGLVREPLNAHDSNAIKVLNTRTVQVGHVERAVAAVLAPLMDAHLISVEGIVPNTRSSGNKYKIPCQIHIFARMEAFPTVKAEISRGGLTLISDSSASFTLSEAVVVKEKKGAGELRSVDEIFKLADEKVSKRGELEVMEAPEEVIKSDLFVHQKEGLWWLLNRENSVELPPFWEEKDGEFVNVLTNYRTDKRPEPLRGGILADDMGLGKTLTLLSLIAFDKYASSSPASSDDVGKGKEIAEEDGFSISDGKRGKRGRVTRKGTRTRKRAKTKGTSFDGNAQAKSVGANESLTLGRRTTLIVCPPSVFSSWITQLEEHTCPGKLKVYMYYRERTQEVEELKKYDIVLTTYSTLATEESWSESPVKKMQWWRVILDEAHMIKNANACQSRAVTNLNSKCRWVVTGTPIQNGSHDLYSLMAFLQFEPFSIKSYWQSLVQRPLAQGNKKGISRLQTLMATISLRRIKEKGLIGLPPKTLEIRYVELSEEERELYDQFEGQAKSVIQGFINDGSLTRNYSTVLGIILRLRQICTSLALLPPDLRSLFPTSNIEDVSNNPELLKKMVAVLQDGEDFDCPICICPPTDMIITCCAHIFCRSCILKTLQCTKPCCPLCRHPLSQSDLFSAPPESSVANDAIASTLKDTVSSKVSALIALLQKSREENPTKKSVVFSQFRKMLIVLEKPLEAAGFKFLRLDGSMNAKKRAEVIQEFQVPGPGEPTVLLASLKASGAGINLTAASTVYLFEPWWNPAVEEQAMDRVHRIGQKEDVKIVRLVARNSIEERVLELQERKKKLAREAFGRKGSKDRREVSANDLRILMSL